MVVWLVGFLAGHDLRVLDVGYCLDGVVGVVFFLGFGFGGFWLWLLLVVFVGL